MGIKCIRAAPLDSVKVLLPLYRCVFHYVSFQDKVPSASHEDVLTSLGHDKNGFEAWLFVGLDLNDEASRLLCRSHSLASIK